MPGCLELIGMNIVKYVFVVLGTYVHPKLNMIKIFYYIHNTMWWSISKSYKQYDLQKRYNNMIYKSDITKTMYKGISNHDLRYPCITDKSIGVSQTTSPYAYVT